MSDRERLGHVIRKFRAKANGYGSRDILIADKDDLLRVLNVADLGLFLSVQGPMDLSKATEHLTLALNDCREVTLDRQKLRDAYKEDLVKIKAAGFEDLDDILVWVAKARLYDYIGFKDHMESFKDPDAEDPCEQTDVLPPVVPDSDLPF